MYKSRVNRILTVKNLIRIAGGIIVFQYMISGCYYDSEEFLFPEINNQCDTSNVTFGETIQPVLSQYCYSCHSNSAAAAYGGNIKLEDYNDVKVYADNGRLLGAIQHAPGYSAMPKGGAKLDDCTINLFSIWIENGTPDN